MQRKIVVIGCGNVGMAYIYALLNQNHVIDEIILIDVDQKRIEGEVMDLNHSAALSSNYITFKVGNYDDCKDATIVCIAVGKGQDIHGRMREMRPNCQLFKTIVRKVMQSGFSGVYLVASNPLDVMCYLTYKYAHVNENKVIGSGTFLDTARLQNIIGRELDINPKNIQAYVIGEHGDFQFVPWSLARIALQKIDMFLSKDNCREIEAEVRNSCYEIMKRKGATYYGIGMALSKITIAILDDEQIILPVSCYSKEHDIFFSKPAIIGKDGIKAKFYMELTEEEQEKLDISIRMIKNAIQNIEE